MRDGWKRVKLGEVVKLVIDYRGKTPKKLGADWSATGYRALSAKSVKTRQIINEESIHYADEKLYSLWMKDEIERGDILITSEAPFGEVYYWNTDEKIVLSQRLFALRCNEDVSSAYVFQYMTGDKFQAELSARATGTTVTGLRQPELLKCEIGLPPIPTQRKIAAVLGALDDKIELNRKMNANLEAQAQALFKSWFVDFEPFGGEMPSGWRNGTLGDVARLGRDQFNPLRHAGLLVDHFSLPAFDDCRFPVRESADVIKSNKFRLTKRSILVSKLNPTIKRVWYPEITSEWSVGSTEFLVFEPKVEDARPWLYSVLNSSEYSAHLIEHATGSTNSHQRVSQDDALAYELTLPPDDIVSSFSRNVGRLYDLILKNINESRKLAELRDALLPKLMSGELEVA